MPPSKKAARKKASPKKPEAPSYETDPETGFILHGNCRPLLAYYNAVQTRFSGLRVLTVGSYAGDRRDMHIDDLFVTPSLTVKPVSLAQAAAEEDCGKNLISELKENPRLVVLGDPGAGKTTIVNWLAWSLTSTETHREINRHFKNHVPIPFILRETKIPDYKKGGKAPTLEEIFEVFTTQPFAQNLREQIPLLTDLFRRGQLFFLFDGIDELSIAKTNWLRKAWYALEGENSANEWPGVLTSRIVGYEPNGFEWLSPSWDEDIFYDEISAALREKHVTAHLPEKLTRRVVVKDNDKDSQFFFHAGLASRRYVAPFDKTRINSFAKSWYKLRINDEKDAANTAKDFLKSLAEHPSLNELRHSPLLLTFMALVYLVREKLPDGRALLYREITDAYLDKLRARGQTPGSITTEMIRKALFHLAWEAQKLRDVTAEVEDRNEVEDEAVEPDGGILLPESLVKKTFSNVFKGSGDKFVNGLLEDCKKRTGLLIPRGRSGENKEEHYTFAHLSFQEYFASQRILLELADEWALWQHEAGEFSRENLAKLTSRTTWHETFILLFESLSAQTGAMNPASFAGYLFDARMMEGENPFASVSWSRKPEELTLPKISKKKGKNSSATWAAQQKTHKLLVSLAGDSRVTFGEELLDQIILRIIPLLRTLDSGEISSSVASVIFSSAPLKSRFLKLLPEANRHEPITHLNFTNCRIDDLSPLRVLTSLYNLDLANTQIINLLPLTGLPSLRLLSLFFTNVTDLSPLESLVSLEVLDISGTKITDLSPLEKFVGIEELYLYRTKITDLSPLKKLSNLRKLYISGELEGDESTVSLQEVLPNLDIRYV